MANSYDYARCGKTYTGGLKLFKRFKLALNGKDEAAQPELATPLLEHFKCSDDSGENAFLVQFLHERFRVVMTPSFGQRNPSEIGGYQIDCYRIEIDPFTLEKRGECTGSMDVNKAFVGQVTDEMNSRETSYIYQEASAVMLALMGYQLDELKLISD